MMNGSVQIERWTSPFKIFSVVRVKKLLFQTTLQHEKFSWNPQFVKQELSTIKTTNYNGSNIAILGSRELLYR
jgi:hypothetical protein